MKRILSGVRPTGIIHLGNYLGAIKQWVDGLSNTHTQEEDNLFCIVDLHALTTLEDSVNLRTNSLLMAATYLACGLSPEKCHIFRQSDVPAHCELSWIFSCITPMGWLSR
ncbi:MAG: tryptophan--tRNA ligase, partial [Alphaproteobacteria bacterium]|nr:tryptophan--tRNA ligase [Alphaproteobacteria bacterium]